MARPLALLPKDVDEEQLTYLAKGRSTMQKILGRLPKTVEAKERPQDSKTGYVVHSESNGHLALSMIGHPHGPGVVRADVHMAGTWETDIILRIEGLGTGFLPLLTLFREPDLVADYLPRMPPIPYIEALQHDKFFADNDWIYHCWVTPFGPLPGADDLHGATVFDCLDEPEEGVLAYIESPVEGATEHRGWPLPPVKSWRRKRNYVLGCVCVFRPSVHLAPLTLSPPGPVPVCCQSPGCRFYAASTLSTGLGTHCCSRCQEKPGKHSALCEKRAVTGPAPPWAIAKHGTVDIDLGVTVKLPIPTWLIPLSFARWVLVKLVRANYPYLLTLNELFEQTPFRQRVEEDKVGFYARCKTAFDDATRKFRKEGRPSFLFPVAPADAAEP